MKERKRSPCAVQKYQEEIPLLFQCYDIIFHILLQTGGISCLHGYSTPQWPLCSSELNTVISYSSFERERERERERDIICILSFITLTLFCRKFQLFVESYLSWADLPMPAGINPEVGFVFIKYMNESRDYRVVSKVVQPHTT